MPTNPNPDRRADRVGRTAARPHHAGTVRASLAPPDRTRVGGIPCTTPARTLVDCATLLGRDPLADLVDAALARRLADRAAVMDALGRAQRAPGRKGSGALRDLLDVWRVGIEADSVGEARLLRQLRRWGLGGFVTQFPVEDDDGRFVARLDVAWPQHRVGLEYDSDQWHPPSRWPSEERRDVRLEALGWVVLHADRNDLRAGHGRLREALHGALGPPGRRASILSSPAASPGGSNGWMPPT